MANFELFIIFYFIIYSFTEEIEECPKETPIKYENNCYLKFCTYSQYINEECKIYNSIIKTQWLDNIILIGSESFRYINLYKDIENNLIIFTYPYYGNILKELNKNRIFYGIKSDGGPLFYNSTLYSLKFKFNIIIPDQTPNNNLFKFYDNNTHNDYMLFLKLDDFDVDYRELYDYGKFKMKGGDIMTFFEDVTAIKRYYFETSDDSNHILIIYNSLNQLLFKGITYYYEEEFVVFAASYININDLTDTSMCSCLRTDNNILGCFYVNNAKQFIFGLIDNHSIISILDILCSNN